MTLTILITAVITGIISLILRLFGIHDNIENDKKILKKMGLIKDKDKKIKLDDKNVKLRDNDILNKLAN